MPNTWVHHKPSGLREPVGELRLKAIQDADPDGEEWEILGETAGHDWSVQETPEGFVTAPQPLNSPYKTHSNAVRAIRRRDPEAEISDLAALEEPEEPGEPAPEPQTAPEPGPSPAEEGGEPGGEPGPLSQPGDDDDQTEPA